VIEGNKEEIYRAMAKALLRGNAHTFDVLGAAQSLLPAVASHYGVGVSGVMWMNGVGGGVMLAVGSLSGALIPGDWDRRLT